VRSKVDLYRYILGAEKDEQKLKKIELECTIAALIADRERIGKMKGIYDEVFNSGAVSIRTALTLEAFRVDTEDKISQCEATLAKFNGTFPEVK